MLVINGVTIKENETNNFIFNGNNVKVVVYNGVTVWEQIQPMTYDVAKYDKASYVLEQK